jgi:hypothetical protein
MHEEAYRVVLIKADGLARVKDKKVSFFYSEKRTLDCFHFVLRR